MNKRTSPRLIIRAACEVYGVPYDEALGRYVGGCRGVRGGGNLRLSKPCVSTRAAIAFMLHSRGYVRERIGEAMGISGSGARYLVRRSRELSESDAGYSTKLDRASLLADLYDERIS